MSYNQISVHYFKIKPFYSSDFPCVHTSVPPKETTAVSYFFGPIYPAKFPWNIVHFTHIQLKLASTFQALC